MSTLTRAEAHDRIDDCGADFEALNSLAVAWGSGVQLMTGADADELEEALHEFVDACADCGPHADKVRLRGNRTADADSDDSTLYDHNDGPDTLHDQLDALSTLLRLWCAARGLPFVSADDLLHDLERRYTAIVVEGANTAATHHEFHSRADWLRAYIVLWELTNAKFNDTAKPGQENPS